MAAHFIDRVGPSLQAVRQDQRGDVPPLPDHEVLDTLYAFRDDDGRPFSRFFVRLQHRSVGILKLNYVSDKIGLFLMRVKLKQEFSCARQANSCGEKSEPKLFRDLVRPRQKRLGVGLGGGPVRKHPFEVAHRLDAVGGRGLYEGEGDGGRLAAGLALDE